METGQGVIGRVWGCILKALPKAGKTCLAAKDYFAYFFIGPYIAIFRNIRSDLGLVSARVLVGGSAGGDSHCFYNQYILPIICSDRFDHLDVFRSP